MFTFALYAQVWMYCACGREHDDMVMQAFAFIDDVYGPPLGACLN